MGITLPSENANIPLDLVQAEAMWSCFYRAPQSLTIASDVLTVPGSGRYTVLPQSGVSDQITSIVLSTENVNGALIQLRAQTAGHTITLVHAGPVHLVGGVNVELTTPFSSVWLRHLGSGVFVQEGPLSYVP